jgi:GxxExxY protein
LCDLERPDRDWIYGRQQSPSGKSGTSFPDRAYPHQFLTSQIIAAAFAVFRALGFGFLESVYRRALAVELQAMGIPVQHEVPYELFHRGVSIGYYRADLVVDSTVMVETKTGLVLDPFACPQLLNCLGVAGLTLGLVLYFGPRGARAKRVVNSGRRL